MSFWADERMNTLQRAINWIGEKYEWTDDKKAEEELFRKLDKVDRLIVNKADIEKVRDECRKLCLFVRRNFNKKGVRNGNKQVH